MLSPTMLKSLFQLLISTCILFWVCSFVWITSIIMLPYPNNNENTYIRRSSSKAYFSRDSNYSHLNKMSFVNFFNAKLQYIFSCLIFSIDDFRQRSRTFSWIFSDSFMQWKKHLQQKTAQHDLFSKVIVSCIVATTSLYHYIKEILIAAYVINYFHPDILSGNSSIYF